MGTANSSSATRQRASLLSSQIGAFHYNIAIDAMVAAVLAVFTATTQRTPAYITQASAIASQPSAVAPPLLPLSPLHLTPPPLHPVIMVLHVGRVLCGGPGAAEHPGPPAHGDGLPVRAAHALGAGPARLPARAQQCQRRRGAAGVRQGEREGGSGWEGLEGEEAGREGQLHARRIVPG